MTSKSAYLFLRISMGIFMACHGLMKLLSGPSFLQQLGSMPPFVPDIPALHTALGVIATAIELVGGILVALGIQQRLACLLIVTVMLSAFSYHLQQVTGFTSLMQNTWPLEIACVFGALAFLKKS